MSDVPTVVEIDCTTGQVTERPLNQEELAQREVTRQETEAMQLEANARAEAKVSAQAKLAALGLTAEEIAAL